MNKNPSLMKFLKVEYLLLIVVLAIASFDIVAGSIVGWAYIVFVLFKNKDATAGFMGNLAFHNKKYPKALKWYTTAAKANNAKIKYINNYVFLELNHGSPEKATEVLASIEKNRDFQGEDLVSIKITESFIEWKKGNLENAISILEPLCKISQSASLYGTLGYLLNYSNNPAKALRFNLDALELEPENILIKCNLAQSYYFNNQLDKAKDLLNKIIELKPNFSEPYFYLGMILKKENNKEEAFEMFDMAYKLPGSSITYVTKERIKEESKEVNPKYEDAM